MFEMEVHLPPDVEKKLAALAELRGRSTADLVQDAIADLIYKAETSAMLDRRYDDIKSGKVQLIPGEEVFARLKGKSEAARRAKNGS